MTLEFRLITQEDMEYMASVTLDHDFYDKEPEPADYVYALRDHDTKETLVIGGYKMMNDTTCVVWYDISPVGFTRMKDVYRVLTEWSYGYTESDGTKKTGFFEHRGIRRAEGYIRTDDEGAKLFILKHKFKLDYTAKNYYGVGCDAHLYVRYFLDDDWSK